MAHSHALNTTLQREHGRNRCALIRYPVARSIISRKCHVHEFSRISTAGKSSALLSPFATAAYPMNWDDVRIFLAIARAGQILGAARRLDLNHATVSRRLAALEEALKAKLFRRLTTGSELTPAGER